MGIDPNEYQVAQEHVLGAIYVDEKVIEDVLDILPLPKMFSGVYQNIYAVILEMYQNNEPINDITVALKLKAKKQPIGDAVDLRGSVANAPYFAKIVRAHYLRGNIKRAIQEIQEVADSEDTDGLADFANERIYQATEIEENQPDIYHQVTRVLEHLEDSWAGVGLGHSWGVGGFLDSVTGGLRPGKTTVIAGLKKSGKTKLVISTIGDLVSRGVPVLFLSLEMGSDAVFRWLASHALNIDSSLIGSERLSPDDRDRVRHCISGIASDQKLTIECRSALTLSQIRQRVRREVRRRQVEVVFFDFIQRANMQQERGQNRATAVQQFAYGLADIARDFGVEMVAVSQLSNEAERAKDLHLGFLKESGGIAEAADSIILLDNVARRKHERVTPGMNVQINLIVDAQREGISGARIPFDVDLRCGRFYPRGK